MNFSLSLTVNAQRCIGPRFESLRRNLRTTVLADAVEPLLLTIEGFLDLLRFLIDDLEHREL